jgi:hypothetical protein
VSNLYEKISHGDRQTIVRKYKAGTELSTMAQPPQTIILKADVALKVTQEYNSYSRTWRDVKVYLDDMVETSVVSESMPRPEPTAMPGPGCDHVAAMTTNGPCPICFPRAEEVPSGWFSRWIRGWFQ